MHEQIFKGFAWFHGFCWIDLHIVKFKIGGNIMNSLIEKIEKSLFPECKVDISSFSDTALRRVSEHLDTLNSQGGDQYKISSLYKNKNNRY